MVTANEFIIPFAVRDGLVYMDMRPPTDTELNEGPNQLLQLILTSDTKWIPSCLDSEPDYDTYFDAISDLNELDYDSTFDDYGEYIGDQNLAMLCRQWYSCI